MTRRQFLKALCLGGVGVAGGWSAYHLGWERYTLTVERRTLLVPGLPPPLEGLRVVHLSDFHAGAYTPWELAERAVHVAMAEQPDIILLTGDYLSMGRGEGGDLLQVTVEPLDAPLGVWAVLGNHDCVMRRHKVVTRALLSAGAGVLNNAAAPLEIDGCEAWVVGLDDPVTAHADFQRAMKQVPAGAFKIMLAHTPDIIAAAADVGVNAVFAGHTHGGQVVIPLLGPPLVPSRYGRRFACGAFRFRDTALHVSRGIGVVPPLVRFCCPPEVAVVTLTAASASSSEA